MLPLPELSPTAIADENLRHWPKEYLRNLHIEMGQQCNVRCSMCFQTDFSPDTKLPDIVWKERLRDVYPHLREITMQGGEPTILQNCKQLIEWVMRDFPQIRLVTVSNGVLWKGIWEEAFLAQGDCVNFSLNALDPQLYEKIVQFGRLEPVKENILRMVRRKKERGSSVIVRISSVILEETVHELADFYKWAVDNGLDQVIYHVDPVLSIRHKDAAFVQKKIAETYELSEKNPQVKLLALEEFDSLYAKTHDLKPVKERSLFKREKQPCHLAFDNMFIGYNGVARPCCKSWLPYGNLVDDEFDKVWNSANAYRFRKRMLGLDFRDCLVACDLNANPIDHRTANARKAYWHLRRDPKAAWIKVSRKFGLNSPQIDLPVLQNHS